MLFFLKCICYKYLFYLRSKQLIKAAIMDNDFLKNLDLSQVRELVESMYPKECIKGSYVIREGEAGKDFICKTETTSDLVVNHTMRLLCSNLQDIERKDREGGARKCFTLKQSRTTLWGIQFLVLLTQLILYQEFDETASNHLVLASEKSGP